MYFFTEFIVFEIHEKLKHDNKIKLTMTLTRLNLLINRFLYSSQNHIKTLSEFVETSSESGDVCKE